MSNGTVIHGRNMDYALHFKMPDGRKMNWPNVTYDAIMMKGGKPLIKAAMWPAMVGIHTAMRYGGWSLEQNTRQNNDWHANWKLPKRVANYIQRLCGESW